MDKCFSGSTEGKYLFTEMCPDNIAGDFYMTNKDVFIYSPACGTLRYSVSDFKNKKFAGDSNKWKIFLEKQSDRIFQKNEDMI